MVLGNQIGTIMRFVAVCAPTNAKNHFFRAKDSAAPIDVLDAAKDHFVINIHKPNQASLTLTSLDSHPDLYLYKYVAN